MGRKRKFHRLEDYARALASGQGVGTGESYLPWLLVHQFSSKGKSSAEEGTVVRRTHHFFSKWELYLFYYLEFDPSVVDIREQFPLFPLDLAERVAAEAGIDYPRIGSDPAVLTTDILATRSIKGQESFAAYAVKKNKDLINPRVREKLEVERLWWRSLGVPWFLVTDKHLNEVQAQNLSWASDPIRGTKVNNIGFDLDKAISAAISQLVPGRISWSALIDQISGSLDLTKDECATVLKIAIWRRRILVDLNHSIPKKNILTIKQVAPIDAGVQRREQYRA